MYRRTIYSRTQNENGTYNTRCLYCFMTVASAVESCEELELIEEGHLCPEQVLSELVAQTPCACHDLRPQKANDNS